MAPAPTLTLSIPEETPPSNLLIVLSGVVLICFLIYGALEYSGFFLRHAQLSDLPPFFELGRVYRVRGPTRNRLAPFSASMARHMAVMSALERGEERRVRDAFLKVHIFLYCSFYSAFGFLMGNEG
ncbi:MAG: hypothetical protein M1814_003848 [Vezdaea aestivalis]|nr:MAG: hypothetical protein M1814_003848 [Vezdaea aestivalis]